MIIGLYTKNSSPQHAEIIQSLISELSTNEISLWLNPEVELLYNDQQFTIPPFIKLLKSNIIPPELDFMITIGGDGTFIESITTSKYIDIPTLGINTGRLGFLADISPVEIKETVHCLYNNQIRIEKRSLIEVELIPKQDINFPLALNEVAVLKRDTSSMIKIDAYIDGYFLTSYWADGLLIATPTGSTAYSMSAGGPIIAPETHNFVITPISPHNLTNRPLIISDKSIISLNIESRDKKFLVSLDSNSYPIEDKLEIKIKKANRCASTVKLNKHNFYETLRNKLMWGIDKRNY